MLSVLFMAGRQDELIHYYWTDNSNVYEFSFRRGDYAAKMFAFLVVAIAWTGYCEYVVSCAYRSIKRESVVPMPPPVFKA
ncbi:hypothetical protein AAVH_41967 [Aphelenchoides avenae]|nr:hypothetical protein AAVH_41967 [Aphelenchus avenae]